MSAIYMAHTYPRELARVKEERLPILIPVGTMEYHSSICPYGCDTLVATGLCDRLAERMDALLLPPIYYGVASYAVAGPEAGSIHVDCDTLEANVYCILKSLFRAGLNRNIYIVICHQTEDLNPMELACRKAARKLTFEYLEETDGYGWWGKRENAGFYDRMSAEDNPWNWVSFITGRGMFPKTVARYGGAGDHAGKYECSMLEELYPGSIKLDRLGELDDWFTDTAREMDAEMGKFMVDEYVESFIEKIRAQRGQ